ncbi:lecithin retinol acyltransferase-like [Branchiostoma floridae]|uniref:Lecithin retinol acyltransferase-like n=1 Tax=Branchiostoma floridae TaxID=7739 RepID=A0A9J7MDB1_BRAFL|nr:lecithin retinol acyltransferase-like [Branchiostoma floridae]
MSFSFNFLRTPWMSSEDVRRNNEGVLSSCKQGDLLEFPRGKFFSHWGVYAGDGKVIHRTGDYGGGSGFLGYPLSSLFPSGVQVGKAKDMAVPSGDEVVERARSRLGETGYNVLWNNCEHFATGCRYGKEQSQQAIVAGSVSTGLTAAGWLTGTLSIFSLGLGALFALPVFQSKKSSK